MDPLSNTSHESVATNNEFQFLNAQLPLFLQQQVSDFLRDLKRPKYSKPLNYEELSVLFAQFYIDFEHKASEYVYGSINLSRIEMKDLNLESEGDDNTDNEEDDDKEKKIKQYVEIAEFKVTSAISDKLMFKSDINNKINEFIKQKIDIILNKIEDLDFYKLLDLDPNLIDLNLIIFGKISNEFLQVQNYKSPYQKLQKLVNIHLEVINSLNSIELNGDYILPIFIYLIILNDNQVDLYLNLLFIKNFRNSKFFKSDELYCLTNIEASLQFIKTLNLKDQFKFKELSQKEEIIIDTETSLELNHNNLPETPERYNQTLNFVTSAFDSSFKNVLNRFKQDPANIDQFPNTEPIPTMNNNNNNTTISSNGNDLYHNPLKNFVGDVMKWTSNRSSSSPGVLSPEPSLIIGAGSSGSPNAPPQLPNRNRSGSGSSFINKLKTVGSRSQSIILEENDLNLVDLSKFKGKNFDDMSIHDLREMFNDYQILANHTKS